MKRKNGLMMVVGSLKKRSHTVEVQIAMRFKRIENLSDHLQINFHK